MWRSDAQEIQGKGWQQEQNDLFTALRRGEILNEVQYAAESTMTAILGRLATYSGKIVRWQEAFRSEVRLANTDSLASLDDPAPVQPDTRGNYEVPVPASKTPMA